ncbi:MAG: hypothetical protein AB4050_17460 [Synechococcus sp.]
MNSYRSLQLKLKEYREAGFAVPALSAKYAKLLSSYQRIQSILQGQSCELPAFAEVVPHSQKLDAMRHASPNRSSQHIQRRNQAIYQWLLIGISVPISLVMFVMLFPVMWFQELRRPERSH